MRLAILKQTVELNTLLYIGWIEFIEQFLSLAYNCRCIGYPWKSFIKSLRVNFKYPNLMHISFFFLGGGEFGERNLLFYSVECSIHPLCHVNWFFLYDDPAFK
jgi:hypothetical protein